MRLGSPCAKAILRYTRTCQNQKFRARCRANQTPAERAQVAFGLSFLHTPPYFLYVLAGPRPRLLILLHKLCVFRNSGSPLARSWPTWPPFGAIMAHLAPLWVDHGSRWLPSGSKLQEKYCVLNVFLTPASISALRECSQAPCFMCF